MRKRVVAKRRGSRPKRAVARVLVEIPLDLEDSHPELVAAIKLDRVARAIQGRERLAARDAKLAVRILKDLRELLSGMELAKKSTAVAAEVADRIHRSEGGTITAAISNALRIEGLPENLRTHDRVRQKLRRLRKLRRDRSATKSR